MTMKVYLADSFPDEEGEMAIEGKTVYLTATRERFIELADFFQSVSDYVQKNDLCHMHFQDHVEGWNKEDFIDIAIELENPNT
jgi:lysyl-tRNA synthetase class II